MSNTKHKLTKAQAMAARYYVVPASPPDYAAIAARALAMPPGVAQFNLLDSIRNGRPSYSYLKGAGASAQLAAGMAANDAAHRQLAEYDDFAKQSALNHSPNVAQAVAEYNAGKPLSQPWFNQLFAQMRAYFQQGQANPGRMTDLLPGAFVNQRNIDNQTGGFDKFMGDVMTVTSIALSAYVGGSFVQGFSGGTTAATATDAGNTASTLTDAGTFGGSTPYDLSGGLTNTGMDLSGNLSSITNTSLNASLGTSGTAVTEQSLTAEVVAGSNAAYDAAAAQAANSGLFDKASLDAGKGNGILGSGVTSGIGKLDTAVGSAIAKAVQKATSKPAPAAPDQSQAAAAPVKNRFAWLFPVVIGAAVLI